MPWIKRFILFHNKRHPSDLDAVEVEAFLTHLAVALGVSASTQNQAKSAILFLYKEVLGSELRWLAGIESAKRPMRLLIILTSMEVQRVLRNLHGIHCLIGRLLYGTGVRILEAMRLRVKDIDFARREITVRDGKGSKDRITMLPNGLARPLELHLLAARWIPERAPYAATILAIKRFSARCAKLCAMRMSPSPQRLTRYGIRLQVTCSNPATTSARCRNCLATGRDHHHDLHPCIEPRRSRRD